MAFNLYIILSSSLFYKMLQLGSLRVPQWPFSDRWHAWRVCFGIVFSAFSLWAQTVKAAFCGSILWVVLGTMRLVAVDDHGLDQGSWRMVTWSSS